MTKLCAICHAQFDDPPRRGRPKLYCSRHCRIKAASANKRPGGEVWNPEHRACDVCSAAFVPFSSRSRFCSGACRNEHYGARTRSDVVAIVTTCMACASTFTTRHARKKTCDDKCRQDLQNRRKREKDYGVDPGIDGKCTVSFQHCLGCHDLVCSRRAGGRTYCPPCVDARRRWHDTKKNHKRRAAGQITISRQELVALRGSKCHICRRKIDLRLDGLHPMGLTIDHLLPVSRGGTNDVSNLDVAHRRCNIARGNRGYFQLGLESDAWAAS